MTNQMANVSPAGTNKFGRASDNSPVFFPPIGIAFASTLIRIVKTSAMIFTICKTILFSKIDIEITFLASARS